MTDFAEFYGQAESLLAPYVPSEAIVPVALILPATMVILGLATAVLGARMAKSLVTSSFASAGGQRHRDQSQSACPPAHRCGAITIRVLWCHGCRQGVCESRRIHHIYMSRCSRAENESPSYTPSSTGRVSLWRRRLD